MDQNQRRMGRRVHFSKDAVKEKGTKPSGCEIELHIAVSAFQLHKCAKPPGRGIEPAMSKLFMVRLSGCQAIMKD